MYASAPFCRPLQTGEIAPKPVMDLIRPEPKPLYALKAGDTGGEAETFHATNDHPWKVEGKGSIFEYGPGGAMIIATVFGPGTDEPLVFYAGGQRRYYHADERGSIIAVTDDAGLLVPSIYTGAAINSYDDHGVSPAEADTRHQYTGHLWLPAIADGIYHYKNRAYHSGLGRFLQTDPIGYGDGLNLYAYVGGDPVNFVDPLGLTRRRPRITCTGSRISGSCGGGGIAGHLSGMSSAGVSGQAPAPGNGIGSSGGWMKVSTPVTVERTAIVVTAPKYVWVSSGPGLSFASRASLDAGPCSTRFCDKDHPAYRFSLPGIVEGTIEGAKDEVAKVNEQLQQCLSGLSSVDRQQVAVGASKGALMGVATGAARGFALGSPMGPAGSSWGATGGSVMGVLTGGLNGAAKSTIQQACQ